MALSVTDPVDRAIDRTKRMLFQPFQAEKWFALGFSAFLAHLGSGGGFHSYRPGTRFPWRGEAFLSAFEGAKEWVLAHLLLIALLAIPLLALGLVLAWLQARGQFMFLDGVARNRHAIAAPWREYAAEGNRLFGFNLLFGLTVLAGAGLLLALGAAIALPDLRAEAFGARVTLALALGLPLLLLWFLVSAVVGVLLRDFVVPAMYRRRCGVREGWVTVHREVLTGRGGTILRYFLMKIALALGVGILGFLACCFTCGCALVPYLGSVILLPILVFNRCFSLHFLEQLGEPWRLWEESEPPTVPMGS